MSGFLCVPRGVWAWDNQPRRNAYIDLQMRACWGEQTFKSKGQSVTVQAGEVLFSVPAAAVWWRCSDKAVRLLMEWLEVQGLVAYPEGKQHRRMFRVTLVDYWGDARGASRGAKKGASRGATKHANSNDLEETGARAGARRRAREGARYIGDEVEKKEIFTVPTEPCEGGGQDLFGEPPPESPPTPAKPVKVDYSDGAQRVLTTFHELSKAKGGNGVPPPQWAAQRKMAEGALRGGMDEQEAIEALRWGMREEFQRVRLRAHGMKVLKDVWSAWFEANGGTNGRNGTGRNGTGYAGGEGSTGTSTGGGEIVLVNGRWERRQG